jgi:hypothetical protein
LPAYPFPVTACSQVADSTSAPVSRRTISPSTWSMLFTVNWASSKFDIVLSRARTGVP